jgi:hypothetical protein
MVFKKTGNIYLLKLSGLFMPRADEHLGSGEACYMWKNAWFVGHRRVSRHMCSETSELFILWVH